jgi:ApaG protein
MTEPKDQPLHACTSEAVTNNVRVEVESQYAPEHSQPFQNHWFFYYTVRITNEGDETVQLLSRHWIVTDASGRVEEVRGPGVVGEQPVLAPGESFQYTSGSPLKTSTGVMRGTYQMVTEGGEHFDVEIAPFALHEPYTVH